VAGGEKYGGASGGDTHGGAIRCQFLSRTLGDDGCVCYKPERPNGGALIPISENGRVIASKGKEVLVAILGIGLPPPSFSSASENATVAAPKGNTECGRPSEAEKEKGSLPVCFDSAPKEKVGRNRRGQTKEKAAMKPR
jgi:hypothetical protein